jgi:hypothetical protein
VAAAGISGATDPPRARPIPVLGDADDAIAVALVLRSAIRHTGPEPSNGTRRAARTGLLSCIASPDCPSPPEPPPTVGSAGCGDDHTEQHSEAQQSCHGLIPRQSSPAAHTRAPEPTLTRTTSSRPSTNGSRRATAVEIHTRHVRQRDAQPSGLPAAEHPLPGPFVDRHRHKEYLKFLRTVDEDCRKPRGAHSGQLRHTPGSSKSRGDVLVHVLIELREVTPRLRSMSIRRRALNIGKTAGATYDGPTNAPVEVGPEGRQSCENPRNRPQGRSTGKEVVR